MSIDRTEAGWIIEELTRRQQQAAEESAADDDRSLEQMAASILGGMIVADPDQSDCNAQRENALDEALLIRKLVANRDRSKDDAG